MTYDYHSNRVRRRNYLGSNPAYLDWTIASTAPGVPDSTGGVSPYSFPGGNESCYDTVRKGPPWRGGGYLYHYRIRNIYKDVAFSGIGINSGTDCEGRMVMYRPPESWLSWDFLGSPSGLNPAFAYGATGWNRFRPTKPVVDLAVAIAEFKDLPGLLFKRLDSIKHVADNHLAAQFGWVPLLHDIRSMVTMQSEVAKRIAQLRRNNGRGDRRGGTILKDRVMGRDIVCDGSSAVGEESYSRGYLGALMRKTYPYIYTEYSEEHKVWFRGKFKYYVPDIGSDRWNRRVRNALMGTAITPAVVWELLPWSWLFDWFGNVGDVIANLSDPLSDDLVAEYAYVMRSRTQKQTTTGHFYLRDRISGAPVPVELSHTLEYVEHYRAEAHPWGFSATWDSLSFRQLTILGALGITRFPKR